MGNISKLIFEIDIKTHEMQCRCGMPTYVIMHRSRCQIFRKKGRAEVTDQKVVCHHSAHDDLFVRARGRRLASTDERSRIYKTARQITVPITARRTSKALHYDQYLLLPPTSCSPSNPRGFHPRCCRTTRFPQQCEPSSST